MRVLIALAGLHRVNRGAEVALEAVGRGLGARGHDVTLLGMGQPRAGEPYRFVHSPAVARERFERFPKFPPLRSEFVYEELTFGMAALARFRPGDYDVTVTCGFPFTNWMLRRPARRRPKHVFVTQNGDWPAFANNREFRWFDCDGLVCTNPEYYDRTRQWFSALIPNGVDPDRFAPGAGEREALGLPIDAPIVLMVSALMPSKRVDAAIDAVARLAGVHLVVAGDGAERDALDAQAAARMPGRYHRLTLPFDRMPALYRSADVFLHTTLRESFGNVYIEALVSGLPVVAHDSPVTRWILGDDGVLLDTEDSAALTVALKSVLQTSGEDASVIAKRAAERFAWDTVVDSYERFLVEVISR